MWACRPSYTSPPGAPLRTLTTSRVVNGRYNSRRRSPWPTNPLQTRSFAYSPCQRPLCTQPFPYGLTRHPRTCNSARRRSYSTLQALCTQLHPSRIRSDTSTRLDVYATQLVHRLPSPTRSPPALLSTPPVCPSVCPPFPSHPPPRPPPPLRLSRS